MSLVPGELPFKTLNSPEDLKTFLSSTDKALLLLEFCGWTPKMLAKENNEIEKDFGAQEDLLGTSFNAETNRTLTLKGKNNQKVAGDERLKCGVENSFNGVPWLGEFSSANETAGFKEIENVSSGVVSSCNLQEFQQFDSFFSKFMIVAREFFLPPERHRFGLVSERSMLSSLGLENSGSWLAVLHVAACPTCSKILKEEDDLRSVLQMDNSVVMEVMLTSLLFTCMLIPVLYELEGDRHNTEPALPANKPSILLFVDRLSNSSETRGKGKEALDAFRELALQYHSSYQMGEHKRDKPEKSSVQAYQALGDKSKHPRLKLSLTAQKIKLKEKLSTIMIINEDKQVTLDKIASDPDGSSLHKILAHLLRQNKEAKLSSLAKELGFQLLSDDVDIKLANTLPSQIVQSNQVSPAVFKEGLVSNSVDQDRDQLPQREILSAQVHEENSELTDGEPSSEYDEEKVAYVDRSQQLISVEAHQSVTALEEAAIAEDSVVEEKSSEDVVVEENSSEDVVVEEKSYFPVDNLREQQLHFQGFEGSFFFSDGNYRLLRALTGGSKIPSLVIIDPLLQQHYVLPQESDFSYTSLADFLNEFLNGSLLPYQQSESIIQSPREATRPPFVNLDFHEVDSIPRVTIHTFSELVLGFNQSNTNNVFHAWNKDVLVLFSNSWCGFCQRMELVVREVYRAVKGYMNMLRSGSRNGEKVFGGDNLKDSLVKLPLIYLMDCTLNDCSLILKSMDQVMIFSNI
uniref:Thioredoxin domain-containing protein n=1 Tax=Fagus sylvatica TaxID=28930 RepID=A0A2N9GKU3_FAGSY